jgi:glycosyltransferase involved in cell wall biosynthesis
VTDVGGNSDVVMEGETGYLVPPDNPAQLALAMRRLMEAPAERRKSFSEGARRHAINHFRFPVIVEKWLRLYGELPEEGRSNKKDESGASVDLAVAK